MSVITTSVGLISGINTGEIIDALINAQRASVARLESRHKNFETTRVALKTLEASLLSVKTSADTLGKAATFGKLSVASTDDATLTATTRSGAVPGTTTLQAVQRAASHVVKTRGFSSSSATVGAGTITIARGGGIDAATSLSLLNGGEGVRLGTIRVTDRAGNSTDVDLSAARTSRDVVDAINSSGAAVTAVARGDRFELTDRSGGVGNLVVSDLAGGSTAADLGIAGNVAATTLSGASVFAVTDSFALSQLNDGNAPRFSSTAADLQVTLSDGTQFDVELSGTNSVRDVLDAINDHADNAGKLTASLVDGRLALEDTTAGTGTLAVADLAGANVVRSLGLDQQSAGATLTGRPLSAGMNTVLLRNLRGGQGIGQLGQISLTDRTGATATLDLSNAESIDDVLTAINTAETAGGQRLAINASIDAAGLGIVLRDQSGAVASNLVIADLGGSTLAADLNIAVDDAVASVRSGHLGRRYVSESTLLATYAPGGEPVKPGNFQITDSAGTVSTISISSQTVTIGDVIDRINAVGVQVTARLNDTGDGIVLIDEAGGTGTLAVTDIGSSRAAANLKIAGAATTTEGGEQQIDGRQSVLLTLDADDSLADLEVKLRSANAGLTASLFEDGSPVNPARLIVSATEPGAANRLRIDDGGLELGFSTVVAAQDALLRVGNDPATGLLVSSETNSFRNVLGSLDVELHKSSAQPVEVTVDRDLAAVQTAIEQFVTTYNKFSDVTAELTRFDPLTNQRGILQGDGTVHRIQSRLDSVLSGRYGTDASLSSLADLGVTFGATGQLVLDAEKLSSALADNPDAAKSFFADKTKGFGVRASAALESLTNPLTGSFKIQDDALADSMDRIERRVADLDEILTARRERLVFQFAKMEEALHAMQSQQGALGQLANLTASNSNRR